MNLQGKISEHNIVDIMRSVMNLLLYRDVAILIVEFEVALYWSVECDLDAVMAEDGRADGL